MYLDRDSITAGNNVRIHENKAVNSRVSDTWASERRGRNCAAGHVKSLDLNTVKIKYRTVVNVMLNDKFVYGSADVVEFRLEVVGHRWRGQINVSPYRFVQR